MAYAVIDLETTGFSPARGDRIIELAVVLVDDDGRPEREWTTLVNPQRDAGRAQVRGIRSEDLAGAPLIGEVASHLVGLLSGRTLVAHNQEFDLRFLKSELASDGFVLPATFDALDTMLGQYTLPELRRYEGHPYVARSDAVSIDRVWLQLEDGGRQQQAEGRA